MQGIQPRDEQALIASLHRVAFDPSGWQGFVDGTDAALPGVAGGLFGVGLGSVVGVVSGPGLDPSGVRRFLDHYHAVNPFAALSLRLGAGKARASDADVSDAEIERTEFYSDWMRVQDDLISGVALKSLPHQGRSLVITVNIRLISGAQDGKAWSARLSRCSTGWRRM